MINVFVLVFTFYSQGGQIYSSNLGYYEDGNKCEARKSHLLSKELFVPKGAAITLDCVKISSEKQ